MLYLNRAVKEVTGKLTTTHVTERIIREAKALLQPYKQEYMCQYHFRNEYNSNQSADLQAG
ncbi:MAG TPA: hypothetical protein VLI68_00235 [Hanamia sp.]|nr:hypothetical protein [Hanamia sp.]